MTPRDSDCRIIEPALLATAIGDADEADVARAEAHARLCPPCGDALARYRAIGEVMSEWRDGSGPAEEQARIRLVSHLDEVRRRTLAYRIVPSPLGPLLIARSEEGVSCIEYLDGDGDFGRSRLSRVEGIEPIPDGDEIETLHGELLDYLEGRRSRLDWPLDFRLARSPFQRAVLEATRRIPYGAVRSYAGLAGEIGKPSATRAVAQALRSNPLPIIVPCHRVVGTSGALTGYAGHRISLKRRLLSVEGVPAVETKRSLRVPRASMYVFAPDHEYCLPTCGWVGTAPARSLVLFGSREHAEAAGLAPCTECRPDLHPPALAFRDRERGRRTRARRARDG